MCWPSSARPADAPSSSCDETLAPHFPADHWLAGGGLQPGPPEKIADAIYRAEGGARARVPRYGILGVPVHGAAEARQVCLRTIDTNRARWTAAGAPGDFIDFLGNVYCPPSADPTGNRNWRHNVKAIVKQKP